MSALYCERCEAPEVVTVEQEPYGDGMRFDFLHCLLCGFSRVTRDDWGHAEVKRPKVTS